MDVFSDLRVISKLINHSVYIGIHEFKNDGIGRYELIIPMPKFSFFQLIHVDTGSFWWPVNNWDVPANLNLYIDGILRESFDLTEIGSFDSVTQNHFWNQAGELKLSLIIDQLGTSGDALVEIFYSKNTESVFVPKLVE